MIVAVVVVELNGEELEVEDEVVVEEADVKTGFSDNPATTEAGIIDDDVVVVGVGVGVVVVE